MILFHAIIVIIVPVIAVVQSGVSITVIPWWII